MVQYNNSASSASKYNWQPHLWQLAWCTIPIKLLLGQLLFQIQESRLEYKILHRTIVDRLILIQNKQNIAAWMLLDRNVLFNLNVPHSFGFPIIHESKSKPFPSTLLNTGWVLPLSPLSLGSKMQDWKLHVFMVVCLSEWFDHEPRCCSCHSDPENPPLTGGNLFHWNLYTLIV